jgi:hypothetical protein
MKRCSVVDGVEIPDGLYASGPGGPRHHRQTFATDGTRMSISVCCPVGRECPMHVAALAAKEEGAKP